MDPIKNPLNWSRLIEIEEPFLPGFFFLESDSLLKLPKQLLVVHFYFLWIFLIVSCFCLKSRLISTLGCIFRETWS